jgi:subtilisin family serine protease
LSVLWVAVALAPATASAAGDPLRPAQWNLDAVHADEARRISDGAGVLVAVIDSGVEAAHPDLVGNIVEGFDYVDGDPTPNDASGHGTHVAGIIAAHADNDVGVAGGAPGAKVLALRVLGADGRGTTAALARAIDAAVAAGAGVINLSLSVDAILQAVLPDGELLQAIRRAVDAGVVVVAAAGNHALPICEQPESTPGILCVGAVDRALERSSYSNYGLRVDLVAPGGDVDPDGGIISTYPGGDYATMAGTSQATPLVSAEAALLLSLGLSGPQAIERIEQTTRDLGEPGPDLVYGRGIIDMSAAVAGLGPVRPLPGSAPSRPTRVSLWARGPARMRIATLLRRGLAVRCRISPTGRCSARLTIGSGRLLARGARRLLAGVTAIVRARATRAAGRLLRRRRTTRATLRVSTPGAPVMRQRIVLLR